MSLFKRGDMWWMDIGLPGRKRVRESTGTSVKKDAQQLHDKRRAELWREQKLEERPERTWAQAVERWQQERKSKRDMDGDKEKFEFFAPHFEGKLLRDITSDFVQDVVEKHKGHRSEATRNRYYALVRAVMRRAYMRWKWLDASQVPFIPQYDEKANARDRFLEPEELERLMKELPEHLRNIATLAVATGLRMKPIIAMRWDWVDLEARTVTVPGELMKNGDRVVIPLNELALAVLRRQFGQDDEFVFVYNGKPVKSVSTPTWYRVLKRAGIKDFRFHDLRRTWASYLIQNGATDRELQELGSWKTASMVRRYAKLRVQHLAPAAGLIDRVVSAERLLSP